MKSIFLLSIMLYSLCQVTFAITSLNDDVANDTIKTEDYDPRFEGWTEEQFTSLDDSIRSALYPPVFVVDDQTGRASEGMPPRQETLPSKTSSNIQAFLTAPSISTDCLVGEIPISSGETPSGAKTYNIPIEAPSGMNGFQPELSIIYNSQSGRSILGYGWSLSGLSSISRTSKNIYYNGKCQGIEMNTNDSFILDGIRLVKIYNNSNYITYESEFGNIKAKAYTSNSVVTHFDVYYPDGRHGVYGYNTTRSNMLSYPLTSMTNLDGNSISYNYSLISNYYRFNSVTYNGNSIQVEYQQRQDPIVIYSSGAKQEITELIQKITCRHQGQITRNYTMSYDLPTSSPYCSLLTAVGCEFGDEQLNPLRFYYGSDNTSRSFISTSAIRYPYLSSDYPNRIKRMVGRIDPYSNSDALIEFVNENPYYEHYRNSTMFRHSQNRFDNLYSGEERFYITGCFNDDVSLPFPTSIQTEPGFIDVVLADVDGTQKESFVKVNNIVSDNNDRVIFKVYKPSAVSGLILQYTRTFNFPTIYTDNDGGKSIQPKYYFAGDFNGNGKQEILAVSCHQPFEDTTKPSKCYIFDLESNSLLFQGHIFAHHVEFVGTLQGDALAAENNTDRLLVFDYDGDGKSDICHITSTGISVYTFDIEGSTMTGRHVATSSTINLQSLENKQLLLGELNGDGLVDLVLAPAPGSSRWNVCYSKGNGQFDTTFDFSISNSGDKKFLLQDVNNDGITDLIECTQSFFNVHITRNGQFGGATSSCGFSNSGTMLVPLNIAGLCQSSRIIGLYDQYVTRYNFTRDETKELLLTGMVNSFGVAESNEYHYANHEGALWGIYTNGSGASFPYNNLSDETTVISHSSSYLNGSIVRNDSFSYQNAIFHRQGLGFCGFSRVSVLDIRGHYTYRYYDPMQYGILIREESSEATNTYTYSNNIASNRIAKILLTRQHSTNRLTGVEYTKTISYNTYGLPTNEVISYNDGITVSTQNTYANNTSVGNGYYIGYQTGQSKTTTSNGTSYSEVVTTPTYANCKPLTRIKLLNGSRVSSLSYTYDSHGNLTSESVSKYSSGNLSTTSYTYDNEGNLATKTNPLGETESFSYDNFGRMSSSIDRRGIGHVYTYDALNREIRVEDDDHVFRATTYSWSQEGTNGRYAVTQSSNTSPTTKKVFDGQNRLVREVSTRFNGSERFVDRIYDTYGNLVRQSLPFSSSAASWVENSYDSYGRILSKTAPTGNTTTYSYASDQNRVSEIKDGIEVTKVYNSLGQLVSVEDGAGIVLYNLHADGQPISVTAPGDVTLHFTYDNFRRKNSMVDPSLGSMSYTYDNEGNMNSETTANGETISYTFDRYGRMTSKVTPEFSTAYTYNNHSDLLSEISSNGTGKVYTYNSKGDLTSERYDAGDGKWFKKTYSYGGGLVRATTFTSHIGNLGSETYLYSHNILSGLSFNGNPIMSLENENELGLPTEVVTGNVRRQYTYNSEGSVLRKKAFSASRQYQDILLTYDYQTNNITRRTYNNSNTYESFSYDGMNRLIGSGVNEMAYDDKGNITSKTNVGSFAYNDADQPYAVTDISLVPSANIPSVTQNITYASFYRPISIEEGQSRASFTYDAEYDRVKMAVSNNSGGQNILTRYYLGNTYELDITSESTSEKLYLGGDYYSAHAVLVKKNGQSNIYNILRDYLGSITHIVASNGSVVQELSYDAWGALRNPTTHEVYNTSLSSSLFLGRGFTGHEHLPMFGLVNMNARLYDPVIGRFLSPDNYIQDPTKSQNFNRYSYCLNNPLRYKDPSGNFIFFEHTIFNALKEAFINTFIKVWSEGFNAWSNSSNWHSTKMAAKIEGGLYKGKFGQVLSRFTWELPQTTWGNLAANVTNDFNAVKEVSYSRGATVCELYQPHWGAFTLGNYIVGERGIHADTGNHLFLHEYGHYLQSQATGLFYLQRYAIPSFLDTLRSKSEREKNPHNNYKIEQDANYRSILYFKNHDMQYVVDDWDTDYNPYSSGLVNLGWTPLLFGSSIFIPGLINYFF